MIGKLIAAAAVALAVTAVVRSLPDIRRYRHIREM